MLINKFTPEQLTQIQIYIDRSIKLRGHDFFKGNVKLSHKLQLEGSQIRIQSSFLNESLLNDFLVRVRIFLLQGSNCNFGAICNLMKKVLRSEKSSEAIYKRIESIQNSFNDILNGKTGVKILPDIGSPRELIDKFMNAKYFHDDIALLKELESSEVNKIISQWGFQYYILELSKRIVDLTPCIIEVIESK